MTQYRLRLVSGRVIGPFEKQSFSEITKNVQLTGNELVQEFPLGEWKPINLFSDFSEITQKPIPQDETFILNIKNLKNEKNEENQNSTHEDDSEEIINKNDDVDRDDHPKEFKFNLEDPFKNKIEEEESSDPVSDESDDKTIVTRTNRKEFAEDDDKTKINPEYRKYLAQLKKEKEEEERRKKEEEKQKAFEAEIEANQPDYENDKTQFLNFKEIRSELESAIQIEEDLSKEVKLQKLKRKRLEEEKERLVKENENNDDRPKRKLSKMFIYLLAALIGIVFLIPDEKPTPKLKPINPIKPTFSFPMRNPVEDVQKAKLYFEKGKELDAKISYTNKLKAAKAFNLSLLNKFNDNPASAKLIFLYSELLNNSKNFNEDAKTVYSLVQLFKQKSYSEPNYTASIANFYYTVGKFNAALNIIERYLALPNNNPTTQLFAIYLKVLNKKGKLEEAEKVAKKLSTQPKNSFYEIKTLYNFYKEQNELSKQLEILKFVSKSPQMSNSVFFLLEKGELFLKRGDIKETLSIIYKINELRAEKSVVYYARYLKLFGLTLAAQKNYKKAIAALRKSLSLFESPQLINELALIKNSGDEFIDALAQESKVKSLNRLARQKLQDGLVNEAFSVAMEALDLDQKNVDTNIILSQIQIKKGYYDDARNQLEELYKNNRSILRLRYELIDIYIETFKYRKALELLESVDDKKDWRYASAKAKLYSFKNEYGPAVDWLVKAISYNELYEPNLFNLALIRLKFFNFDKAKFILNKVMDLDPFNIEYKIAYAKILYEVETAAAAIGYLYDILQDFKDHPKILAEIGIYYYKSGQIKNYRDIKKKLEELYPNEPTLYNFLLESAKLDDDFDDIVKYSEEILKIEPGNSKIRLFLAEVLIKMRGEKNFIRAKYHLDEIKKRFSTFPRLNYLYAKLYTLINRTEEAIALGEKEIKENPRVSAGYILLGDIYKEKKELLKARDYYQQAYILRPNDIDALMGLAYVAFHSNQFDLALDQYKKIIQIDKFNAEAYKMLGDLYKKLGRVRPAIESYKQFLELYPNYKYKSEILNYIRKME
ncbi:MAG: hypothetical protein CME62_17295 [Halobacteriovoraceae bacterium]|nr:hypothetical protein [Halobacteriovoraceae bacterium]|tara:strand:- start:1412 stop:4576 length:3165 start_codon:yes stop_codon:yes gene_type:complete